jgi:cobaltochelatase CobT
MSNKETTLKEKFKLALTSTAKVISDDFELNSKSSDKKKQKEINTIEIEDLNNPSDFMRLRAETDSAALKKNFLMKLFIEKIYPLIVRQDHFII